MAVSLGKISDNNPIFNPGRVYGSYVGKINRYLRQWDGPLTRQTEDDLRKNDLRGLENFLYLASNDPTPGQ